MKKVKLGLLCIILITFSVINGYAKANNTSAPNIVSPTNNAQVIPENLKVQWDKINGATGYLVTVTDTQNWNKVFNSTIPSYSNSCTVSSYYLKDGSNYRIYVQAKNAKSGEVSYVDIRVRSIKVKAPTIIKPENGSLLAKDNVKITWEMVDGATGYLITVFDIKNWKKVYSSNEYVGTTSKMIPTYALADGNPYRVYVQANNAEDGAVSTVDFSTKQRAPSYPSSITSDTIGSDVIILKWKNVIGASSYNIYRANSSNLNYSLVGNTIDTRFSDINLSPNTNYYYKVSSLNETLEGPLSNSVSFRTTLDSNISDISVAQNEYSAEVGKIFKINYQTVPADKSTFVNWQSMDSSIARVDKNGNVFCVNAGTTKIIISSINCKLQKEVIVNIYPTKPYSFSEMRNVFLYIGKNSQNGIEPTYEAEYLRKLGNVNSFVLSQTVPNHMTFTDNSSIQTFSQSVKLQITEIIKANPNAKIFIGTPETFNINGTANLPTQNQSYSYIKTVLSGIDSNIITNNISGFYWYDEEIKSSDGSKAIKEFNDILKGRNNNYKLPKSMNLIWAPHYGVFWSVQEAFSKGLFDLILFQPNYYFNGSTAESLTMIKKWIDNRRFEINYKTEKANVLYSSGFGSTAVGIQMELDGNITNPDYASKYLEYVSMFKSLIGRVPISYYIANYTDSSDEINNQKASKVNDFFKK